MKKLFALLLALTMVFSLAATAFAAENTTISVNDNRTYAVYQIFTGDLSGTTLSNIKWGKNGSGTEGEAVDQTTLSALAAVVNSGDVAKLAEIEKYVKMTGEPTTTVSKDSPANVITGYYLLKDVTANVTGGDELSAFVVEIVGPTTISPKVDNVTSQKKVKDTNDTAGSTTGWQDSADYDIGDDVPFQLTGTVTGKYDHYDSYYYAFHDTLYAGLTFNNDVKVYVDGVGITSGYEVVTTGLTDGCTFEVRFADLKDIKAVKADSVITVEYTARLNENAVHGSAGNPNVMHLEYANNPNWDGIGDEPTGETPNDKVIVFTYKVVVKKVDGETKEELAGAGFTLYKKNSTGAYVAVGEELTGEALTTFEWKGLDDGDYKLSETTTPAGYNTMADIEFTITADHEVEAADPKLTKLEGGTLATGDVSTGAITKDIENNKGTQLPETGGMGTTLFYIVGGIMVAAAVVLLVTKKRMGAEG